MLRALALLSVLCVAGEAPACQLQIPAPFARFDNSLFVLTGIVREIVGPVDSADVRGEVYALRIAIDETLHSPRALGATVDVFEYNLGGACDALGIDRESLERRFPLGTAVRVIAYEALLVPPATGAAALRIEAGPRNPHSLVAPIYPEDPVPAALTGTYDFVKPLDINHFENLDAARFDWFWYQGMVQFEAVKELLRLESARDDAERVEVLRRARRIPNVRSLDFAGLVRAYVRDPAVASALAGELE